jgi:hypothetical protein
MGRRSVVIGTGLGLGLLLAVLSLFILIFFRGEPEPLDSTSDLHEGTSPPSPLRRRLRVQVDGPLEGPGESSGLAPMLKLAARESLCPADGAAGDDELDRLVDDLRKGEKDAIDLRLALEDLLRRRPHLARRLLRVFETMEDREILFQIAQVLQPYATGEVLSALLKQLRRPTDSRHAEMAVYALRGAVHEERVRKSVTTVFLEEGAPEGARTAAAFVLQDCMGNLESAERKRVRARARDIAAGVGGRDLRIECIDLIAGEGVIAPEDREILRSVLRGERDVRILAAAARGLVVGGTPPAEIVPDLKAAIRAVEAQGGDALPLRSLLDGLSEKSK